MNKRNHSARQLPFFSKSNDQTLSVDRIPRTIALLLTIVTEQYSVGYKALSPYGAGNLVVVIDDGLRRVFIGQNSVANANGESQRNEIEFDIVQKEYNGSEGTNGQLVKSSSLCPRHHQNHTSLLYRQCAHQRQQFKAVANVRCYQHD